MKIKQILITSGIAATLALGVGVGLGSPLKASEVKAADAVASGTITVDLVGENWGTSETGQNISVYFWDSESHNGWGSYVFAGQNKFLAKVDYSLDFTPTNMKAVRYSNAYTEAQWQADPWCEADKSLLWGETDDLAYTENGNIIVAASGYSFVGFPYAHGKNSASSWAWGTLFTLDKVKMNLSGDIEYYADYDFPSGWNEFGVKLWSTDWFNYSNLTISSFADDEYWGENGGNIIRKDGAPALTARVYYNRNAGTLYINLPSYADADEWGQTFLDSMTCDGNGNITSDNWSTLSTSYSETLSDDVKAIYKAISEDGGDGTIAESAVKRYDYIIKKYGTAKYNDFMGRVETMNIPYLTIQNGTIIFGNNIPIFEISIAVISAITLATLLVIKKKKQK